MATKLRPGFEKADSYNIPMIDCLVMDNFSRTNALHIAPEIRNVKTARNSRASYGESAIGYVQVKRERDIITVLAAVSPQQNVTSPSYLTEVVFDIKKNSILSASCDESGCEAASGGCKHGIALISWLHRRTEEPAPTEVACYWKKSELSRVGSTIKYIEANKIVPFQKKRAQDSSLVLRKVTPAGSFLKEVMEHISTKVTNNVRMPEIYRHFRSENDWWTCLDLHQLSTDFKSSSRSSSVEEFVAFMSDKMSENACHQAAAKTLTQANDNIWHKLRLHIFRTKTNQNYIALILFSKFRYCRVTASTIYQVSRCKTTDGTLVNMLFGAKLLETGAMARGKRLEPQVLKEVEKIKDMGFKPCGIILNPTLPVFGASPDGINEDLVVEIKCPVSVKTVSNYIKKNGQLTEKAKAQIQPQMHMANKSSGLFCVASPTFEEDKKVQIVHVEYEEEYVDNLVERAMKFWEKNIGKKLIQDGSLL